MFRLPCKFSQCLLFSATVHVLFVSLPKPESLRAGSSVCKGTRKVLDPAPSRPCSGSGPDPASAYDPQGQAPCLTHLRCRPHDCRWEWLDHK